MSRPIILMYHRIADDPIDHWGLCVSPARFEEQLVALRRTRHPLPLLQFTRQMVAGTLSSDAVALTFDDGYADNFTAALPLLTAADIPATVFVATGYVGRDEPFWWDELVTLILFGEGPAHFELAIAGTPMSFDLDTDGREDRQTQYVVSQTRRTALDLIYQRLRRLDKDQRTAAMCELRSILITQGSPAGRPMTADQVRQLAAGGLVSVGAHTVTHPVLTDLDPLACRHEVTASKLVCEALVGTSVAAFAYPFGEFNAATSEIVRNAGFAFACTTRRGGVDPVFNMFELPRVYVPNVDLDVFERRLQHVS
jgi:peptidoglycan/xylan/chitin deacetylase (PgdA/CDA1 family)